MKQLRVVIGALLTTLNVRLALTGMIVSLALLGFKDWPAGQWTRYGNPLERPEVDPFFRSESPAGKPLLATRVLPHHDWRDVRAMVRKPASKHSLVISKIEAAFGFLPRSTDYRGAVEPGQPEHLNEIIPDLERLSLYETKLTPEDWRDIGTLQNLWLLEAGDITFPDGESDSAVRIVAEALSALPYLRHLNLTGNSWMRLGNLARLESVALDASRLEEILGQTEALQLPRLKVVYLRIAEDFSPTVSQVSVLRNLAARGVERVELWTGRRGQHRWLQERVDELRGQLPELDVRVGEAGFGVMVIVSMAILLGSLLSLHNVVVSIFVPPQNGFLPGLDRLNVSLPPCYALFVSIVGGLFAILLEVRWWGPVLLIPLLSLLMFSLTAYIQRNPKAEVVLLSGLTVVMLSITTSATVVHGPFMQCVLGDVMSFNILILALTVISIPLSIAVSNRLYIYAAEKPRFAYASWAAKGFGSSSRIVVTGKIPGPKAAALVPANLRSKDFSERLRCVNQTMAGEMGKNSWWICLVLLFIPEWNDFLPSKTMDTKNTFAGWWGVFTLLSILVVTLVILQALCFLQVWLVRSRRLASDFLFPIGRQEYWRMMRWAVLKDFRLPFLFSFILMAAATLKTPNDAWHWAQRLPQFVLLAGQLLACCGVIVIFAAQRRTLQPIVYIFLAVIGLAIAGMIMDFSLRHPVFWYFNAALAALGFGLWMALPKVMQNFELPAQTR